MGLPAGAADPPQLDAVGGFPAPAVGSAATRISVAGSAGPRGRVVGPSGPAFGWGTPSRPARRPYSGSKTVPTVFTRIGTVTGPVPPGGVKVTEVACAGATTPRWVVVPNARSYSGCGTTGGRWLAAYAAGSRSVSRARSYRSVGVPVTRNWSTVRVFGP